MKETSKAHKRRLAEGFYDKYLVGKGIDIGCGDDPITNDCTKWDLEQGDAQYLKDLGDNQFDWVYSSHCLEHMQDPQVALKNWWRVLKAGGYLIVTVPDEDLYEQRVWPPRFNGDHKTSWTIKKKLSWCPYSKNLKDLIEELPAPSVEYIKVIDTDYRYYLRQRVISVWEDKNGETLYEANPYQYVGDVDQTSAEWQAEACIEAVVLKIG